MKKYLALILFELVTSLAFAQSTYEDVVYLKNGSIIRGAIIEHVPDKSIKIKTADRSMFVYQMDEIEKFTKEEITNENDSSGNKLGLEKGLKKIIEMGFANKLGDYGKDRYTLNIIYGYQFNPYFSLGLGTGLHYYYQERVNDVIIPVFADLRLNFANNKISPYIALGAGYSFEATTEFNGLGVFLNPTAGVSLKFSNKSTLNIGLGFERQKMDLYEFKDLTNRYTIYKNSDAICMNVGISF
jgi:hypothetical protein